ncbi:trypsin-like peptidase domain-containing protein [Streptomyces sp. ACA25]|uniref:effector-associated domain 2-containing protein n=1 Tax=Streptomyces sp. ACA25 TaxID=3022596 RepID=UPI0023081660|nr:trypsin-like peptidase domain-containing protein [Streptomyces sp. ACA25]MDB1088316.1 trypsin-like peptidase domain-containing protein [Streptomyces sp. ACA25]
MGAEDEDRAPPRAAFSWRARIRGRPGTDIVGAAVLVPGGRLLTCAHVVEAALRTPRTPVAPDGTVLVDFPAAPEGDAPLRARVAEDGWLRSGPAGDLAVLRLLEPLPPGPEPAPTGGCGLRAGFEVAAFGHPPAVPTGVWSRARVAGAGGPHPGWQQLDGLGGGGARMERGFSGAGAWDVERSRVTGVVAAVLETREPGPTAVAWMIPLDVLRGTRFGTLSAGNAAGGGSAAAGSTSPAGLWPLVECLQAVEAVGADGGAALLSLLPGRISGSIPRQSRPHLQLFHTVRRCGEFEDGPAALVEAVRRIDGETIAMKRFADLAGRTWPRQLGDHE